MAPRVRLADIIDALEINLDEHASVLDLATGQVETVDLMLLRKAEDGESDPHIPQWQQHQWEIAKRMAAGERFERLPSQFDVNEWQTMADFVETVESAKVRDDLNFAIHGAGAFRNFKRIIRQHRIEEDWNKFRDAALRELAIEWCEENEIPWE